MRLRVRLLARATKARSRCACNLGAVAAPKTTF